MDNASENALLAGSSAWIRAQYHILKRISPREPTHMSGAAYEGVSKLRVLLGDDLMERIRDRDVLDFGCGAGHEAVEMASVARSVFGLDIQEGSLIVARERAAAAGVSDRCTFQVKPPDALVDMIVSLDSFEHFSEPKEILLMMYELLKPGGHVLISFGPTWYHPLGGHLFSVFPWAHLVFNERALLSWRADFKSDGAERFSEVAGGLNQMTIARFMRLVGETKFRVELLEPVPIRRLRSFAAILPREFTSAIVRCVLKRPDSVMN